MLGLSRGVTPLNASHFLRVINLGADYAKLRNSRRVNMIGAIEIPLTRGFIAFIDEEDEERVNNFAKSWQVLLFKNGTAYAKTTKRYGPRWQGKSHAILLHQLIMNREYIKDSLRIDHIDGDGLDCRKKNLRIVSPSLNGANRIGLQSNNMSGFHGVYWNNQKQKWHAEIIYEQKKIHVGFFTSPQEAEFFRLKKIKELWPNL